MRSAAGVISRIFDPVIVVPVIIFGVLSLALVNGFDWGIVWTVMFFDAVVPGVYVLVRFIRNGGKDWYIRDKKDRLPLFGLAVASHLMGVFYVFWLGIQPLGHILLVLWLLSFLFALVTNFWKISVHAGVNTTLALLAVHFFGWEHGWVFMIPVVVGWARVVEEHHTVGQVVMGSLVPVAVVWGGFYLLGI